MFQLPDKDEHFKGLDVTYDGRHKFFEDSSWHIGVRLDSII